MPKSQFRKHPSFPDFQAHCLAMCHYLENLINVTEYQIDISFKRVIGGQSGVAAKVVITDVYLEADIEIGYPCFEYFLKGESYKLMNVLCHEYCHFLTIPQFKCAASTDENRNVYERQTQRMANALMKLIPHELYKIRSVITNEKTAH